MGEKAEAAKQLNETLKALLSRNTFASAVAGSMGSMLAMTLLYPLDRVRTIAQIKDRDESDLKTAITANNSNNDTKSTSQKPAFTLFRFSNSSINILRQIIKDEGIDGLYIGLRHMLVVLGCSNFVYFYFNSALKSLYTAYLLTKLKRRNVDGNVNVTVNIGNVANLVLASVAGVINVLLTTPLWVVATRLATQRKKKLALKSEPKVDEKVEVKSDLLKEKENELEKVVLKKYLSVSSVTTKLKGTFALNALKLRTRLNKSERRMTRKKSRSITESEVSSTEADDEASFSNSDVDVDDDNVSEIVPVTISASFSKETEPKLEEEVPMPDSIIKGVVFLAKTEGIAELWSGTLASLVLVSNPVIQFFTYEKMKRFFMNRKLGSELNSVQYFLIGAAAKMVATVLTYPLQLSQTRLRNNKNKSKNVKAQPGCSGTCETGVLSCLSRVYFEEGFKGWFKGMDAKLLQTCLTAAFMFVFYEKLYKVIYRALATTQ